MLRQFLSLVALLSVVSGLAANELSIDAVNSAEPNAKSRSAKGLDALIVKTQVLLDRAHFSPGEIDGKQGDNLQKALRAYAGAQAIASDGRLTDELWGKLSASSRDPVLQQYAISAADLKGPFTERLPSKLEEMKDLPALGYRSAREAIAEKFHMSEELLTALNPGKKFDAAGETIIVANVSNKISGKGARIEVDKSAETLKVFDGAGRLLAVYPATVGSEQKPAPDGTLRITSISRNPVYRYDPEYKFKGVKSQEPFTIRPGPNNPVGTVWIGLSQKSYGIHGTPHPEKVSKTESQGCVRLTNWDAEQVASLMQKGSPVAFVEGPEASSAAAPKKAASGSRRR